MAVVEHYQLTCWRCLRVIEVPAGEPEARVLIRCPHCGAELDCWWRCAEAVGLTPGMEGEADGE